MCGVVLATCNMSAGILTGPIINPANGHLYYLLSQSSWTVSEAEAMTFGGHLTTIDDQTENDWVFNNFSSFGGTPRCLWIGLTDNVQEGLFTWSSNDLVSYTHWQTPSQPDNASGIVEEDYVHLLPPGHYDAGNWNDFQNLNSVFFADVPMLGQVPMNGVVEVVPEPTVTWQLVVGIYLASRMQRIRK